jgi:hypothetical protein
MYLDNLKCPAFAKDILEALLPRTLMGSFGTPSPVARSKDVSSAISSTTHKQKHGLAKACMPGKEFAVDFESRFSFSLSFAEAS